MFKVVVSDCEMFLPFHAGQFCDLHEILVNPLSPEGNGQFF